MSRVFGNTRPIVLRAHDPVDTLLVLALDLLSQTEAQHRAARRLERRRNPCLDVMSR